MRAHPGGGSRKEAAAAGRAAAVRHATAGHVPRQLFRSEACRSLTTLPEPSLKPSLKPSSLSLFQRVVGMRVPPKRLLFLCGGNTMA